MPTQLSYFSLFPMTVYLTIQNKCSCQFNFDRHFNTEQKQSQDMICKSDLTSNYSFLQR